MEKALDLEPAALSPPLAKKATKAALDLEDDALVALRPPPGMSAGPMPVKVRSGRRGVGQFRRH